MSLSAAVSDCMASFGVHSQSKDDREVLNDHVDIGTTDQLTVLGDDERWLQTATDSQ